MPASDLPPLPRNPPPRFPDIPLTENYYEEIPHSIPSAPPEEKEGNGKGCGTFWLCVSVIIVILIGSFVYSLIIPYFRFPSCSEGYQYLKETGFCYKVITSKAKFDEADEICKSEQANLASIHSKEENRLLADMARKSERVLPSSEYISRLNEEDEVIIGLFYDGETWKWTDGTVFDYRNWSDGEPNRLKYEWTTTLVTSKIAQYNPHGQLWNNVPTQSKQRAFICKKVPSK